MLTERVQKIVIAAMACLVCAAFVGCSSGPKYGPYNLNVTVGSDLTSNMQRLDVDVVGTTEEWNLSMEDYWATRAENERQSGMAQTLWFEGGADTQSITQSILKNDDIWDTWRDKGVKYLFVIPHHSKWRGQKGKTVNLSSEAYEKTPKGFEILIYDTYANVNTIF